MHESENQVIFPSLSYSVLLLFLAVIFQMAGGVFMAIVFIVLGLPIKPEEPAFVGTINLLAFGFLLWLGNYLTGRPAKKTYPFTSSAARRRRYGPSEVQAWPRGSDYRHRYRIDSRFF
jgi:predicted MFS family arabinose efflux permease